MIALNQKQEEMCTKSRWDFSDLSAIFLNCTLKRSPELSHTQALIDTSKTIMEKNGVDVEVLRSVGYDLAHGVWPAMAEHGWESKETLQTFVREGFHRGAREVLESDTIRPNFLRWKIKGSACPPSWDEALKRQG